MIILIVLCSLLVISYIYLYSRFRKQRDVVRELASIVAQLAADNESHIKNIKEIIEETITFQNTMEDFAKEVASFIDKFAELEDTQDEKKVKLN